MIMEMNSRELHRLELIAALDAQLQGGQEPLKTRLQGIPNAWRDYRMCTSRIGRIVQQLYTTVPDKTLRHMQALCSFGEVLIRLKPAARTNDLQLLMTKDIKLLVNLAMEYKCTMCFADRAEIKACELRKALMNVAPPVDTNLGPCPYRYVIEEYDAGHYI